MKKLHFLLVFIVFTFFATQAVAQSIAASAYTFSASSNTYSYLTGGTPITAVEVDDGYTNIPIGFTFKFCGVDYTTVTVCSNGWLRFGSGVGTAVANWNYNATPNSGIEPAVYALYEDVSGDGGTSSYLVSGTSPNRIFKWECRDWLWDFASSVPGVSFQVWLYESTGVIECRYKVEDASAIAINTSGGATIGIGSSSTDWQVLDNVSANPTPSSTTYVANLSTSPATGQTYAWDPGPICNTPTGLTINNVNSTSVDFSWTGVSGSIGYEYVVDQNSSAPLPTASTTFTSNTNATETNLTPSTQYYVHIRSQCGTMNFSSWITYPVLTLPPCVIATNPGITFPYIDSNTADIIWPAVSSANSYQYILKPTNTTPSRNAAGTGLNTNQYNATSLTSGATYYFFLRVICAGNDTSDWFVDSFYVPMPCRAPAVGFTSLNQNRAVAYWTPAATAKNYEILLSEIPLSNPTTGTMITSASYLLPYLDDGTTYYFYVRSHCDDRGVKGTSDWSEASFTTWALGINNVKSKSRIGVYPNPVHNSVVIDIDEKMKDTRGVIDIIDITGKHLISKSVACCNVTLDVSMLPSGVYILQYSNENYVEQTKLIKE